MNIAKLFFSEPDLFDWVCLVFCTLRRRASYRFRILRKFMSHVEWSCYRLSLARLLAVVDICAEAAKKFSSLARFENKAIA